MRLICVCVGDRLEVGVCFSAPRVQGPEKQLWNQPVAGEEGAQGGSVCSFRRDGGGGRNKNPQRSLHPGTSSRLGTVSWPRTLPPRSPGEARS